MVASRSFWASRSFVASSRWHACRCSRSSEIGTSGGSTGLHLSITYGQRGGKRQPPPGGPRRSGGAGGGRSAGGGGRGIWTSRSRSVSRRGSDPKRPHVYG